MTKHKTGYHCWLYGMCSWHRTEAGAVARAKAAQWCSSPQVVEVATGNLVYGVRS
jgi:hypothetical protein